MTSTEAVTHLSVGLKEWQVVCDALLAGEQILLLRKGGIHDTEGVFSLDEKQFLLFPTHLHQKKEMVKPYAHTRLKLASEEPGEIVLSGWAEVSDIVRVKDRAAIDRVFDQHLWDVSQIDMRFNYKPTMPLYVVLLRAWKMQKPVTVENTAEYAGCKSWVPLGKDIDVRHSKPALTDMDYAAKRKHILSTLGGA